MEYIKESTEEIEAERNLERELDAEMGRQFPFMTDAHT
jgi:hypothetical protein